MFVMQVAAANREVEATNAKRAQESERSLQALRQKAADDYTKQVSLVFEPLWCQHWVNAAVHAAQLCAFIHFAFSVIIGPWHVCLCSVTRQVQKWS